MNIYGNELRRSVVATNDSMPELLSGCSCLSFRKTTFCSFAQGEHRCVLLAGGAT
jgi:hypothetical protein